MKNMLFTGIIGENPAVLINREQAPGDQGPSQPYGCLFSAKTVARNIVVAPTPSFAATTGLLL